MSDLKTPAPDQLLNREMSWLEFNQRVLEQAEDESNPLLERLKFLAITGSNLDEFFMVRIGSLHILIGSQHERPDATGFKPSELLAVAGQRIRKLMEQQYRCFSKLSEKLLAEGIAQWDMDQLSRRQLDYLHQWFEQHVVSVLAPLAMDADDTFPLLADAELAVCVQLQYDPNQMIGGDWKHQDQPDKPACRFAILPLGSRLDRFVTLPGESGHGYVLLESVIKRFIGDFFPGQNVINCSTFRVTRNADMRVDEDGAFDLLHGMQEILGERKESDCVRLEVERDADETTRQFLMGQLRIAVDQLYQADGPLRLKDWFSIAGLSGYDRLKYDPWPSQDAPHFAPDRNIFDVIRDGDRILVHPYQSYDPVVRFLESAADDPDVLAIKQTLYRTSRRSQIVRALARAAENRKSVTAIVELKARFDEERNIMWAKSLERAGVNVIYGLRGLKTHAKVCLVVRRDPDGLRRYCHFGTGNYNESTAGLYSDVSFFTCDDVLGSDAVSFFNAVTAMSMPQPLQKLAMAPLDLRQRMLEMIAVEAENARKNIVSGIRLKLNSLVDPLIIAALYQASQCGVPIELNVRGICCLKPGVPGLSEKIRVTSIVDRYLEHARIFFFQHGGDARVFIASADMMARNLDRRVELLVPVEELSCRNRLLEILDYYFRDNVKARELHQDGQFQPINNTGPTEFRCQYELYKNAVQQRSEHFSAERSMFQPYRPDNDPGL